jgi:hypothetical protein
MCCRPYLGCRAVMPRRQDAGDEEQTISFPRSKNHRKPLRSRHLQLHLCLWSTPEALNIVKLRKLLKVPEIPWISRFVRARMLELKLQLQYSTLCIVLDPLILSMHC